MKCSLNTCNNTISKARKKTAKYCSDKCYYEAKKERSSQRYALLKAPTEEMKRNESILAFLYDISIMNKPINADDLSRYSFNFALSTGEHLDAKKGPCKIVGSYAYHINSDKTLCIWKLKQYK
jgi:hypothetical protein